MAGKLIVCKFKCSSVEFRIWTFSLRFHSAFALQSGSDETDYCQGKKKKTPFPSFGMHWLDELTPPYTPKREKKDAKTVVHTHTVEKSGWEKHRFIPGMPKENSPSTWERVKRKINATAFRSRNNVLVDLFSKQSIFTIYWVPTGI